MRDAVDHLVGLGHRRIVYVNHSASALAHGYGPAQRTRDAFTAAMAGHGLEPLMIPAEDSAAGGRAALGAAFARAAAAPRDRQRQDPPATAALHAGDPWVERPTAHEEGGPGVGFTDGYWQVRPGVSVLRPGTVILEFPDDPTSAYLDRQYLLGPDVLVAPVLSADGEVTYYVPAGTWTHLVSGAQVTGPGWVTETHDFDSVPVLARPGAVIPFGAVDDRPDYAWADDVRLRPYAPVEGQRTRVRVPAPDGGAGAEFEVRYENGNAGVELTAGASSRYRLEVIPALATAARA